jgi:putative SOS response-associated peptidase YedK
MCGRFIVEREWREIYELYELTLPNDLGRNTEARYNIAPTDPRYSSTMTVTASNPHRDRGRKAWYSVAIPVVLPLCLSQAQAEGSH